MAADGALMEREQEIDANDVPPAVLEAAQKGFGENGSRAEFERKTVVLYEVEVKGDGKEHEILVTPAGRLLTKAHGQVDN